MRSDDAIAVLALCVGGLSLARAVPGPALSDPAQSDCILAACRRPAGSRRRTLALQPGRPIAMPLDTAPFGPKKFLDVKGRRMAYVEEGEGDAILFQHGNPTSSYLWRNVMPHCRGLGRLIACDLIGMGDSDRLPDSGPERYTYAEQRDHLFALWDALGLGDRVVLVLHDWGSALGFDWASRHRDRVAGIAYMEAIVTPVTWDDWPENARKVFQGFRSPAGEEMVLQKNIFRGTGPARLGDPPAGRSGDGRIPPALP